jgi:hypothetical protein
MEDRMGYSIMVEFPNTEIRDRIYNFLSDNAKSFMKLTKSDIEYVRGPVTDPSYTRKKSQEKELLIGYDFTGSSDLQSRIAYLFCYWMIKRVPKSKFWYDGQELWSIPEECDEHGFHDLSRLEQKMSEKQPNTVKQFIYEPIIKEISQFNEPVHNELKRLTKLWSQMT